MTAPAPPPLPPAFRAANVPHPPSPPVPRKAAAPYFYSDEYPVQETNPSPETQNGIQATAPTLPTEQPAQLPPQPPLVQAQPVISSGYDEKKHPVQETEPAPQAQNEPQQANHLRLSGAPGPQDRAPIQTEAVSANSLMEQTGRED